MVDNLAKNDTGYIHWNPRYVSDSGVGNTSEWCLDRYFSLSNVLTVESLPEPYIGHLYMTRPNLYLNDEQFTKIKSLPMMGNLIRSSADIDLFSLLGSSSSLKWIPVVTNYARNYSVNDIELKTVEKGTTYFGNSVHYPKNSEEFKHGNTITIEFNNDSYLSVLRTMWFWFNYMYYASKEDYLTIDFNTVWYGEVDWDASLFFLVTKRDFREIVYWEELVGIHPRRIPLSDFSWNNEMILNPTISIDFEYSVRRDPMDIDCLVDMNILTIGRGNATGTSIIRRTPDSEIQLNDILAAGPVITCQKLSDGKRHFFLEHYPASGYSNNSYYTEVVS